MTAALDTKRPFTRADAIRAGLDLKLLRGSLFRRVFRGVYVRAEVPDSPLVRVEAALAVVDKTAFASHASAARVYDVPIPTQPDEHVSVLDPDQRRSRAGVRCSVNPRPDLRIVHGVRVSAPAQLFVELASILNLVDLVVVGDNLVRTGRVTSDQLVDYCTSTELPAAAAARRAARYVRPRVDSPMETRLRMLLVLAGLPEPMVNITVADLNGQPLRRYDLCWPEVKVIVEYDGRPHIEREDTWESDLDRREAIDDDEWRILVVVANGSRAESARVVRRSEAGEETRADSALRRRLLGVPTRPGDAWRPHFPSRP